MKQKSNNIGKATEFLRKTALALRCKVRALRARLLFLTSFRRRAAIVAGISRQIHALSPPAGGQEEKKAAGRGGGRAVVLLPLPADYYYDVDDDDGERVATTHHQAGKKNRHGDEDDSLAVGGMAELARLFREVDDGEDDGGADWTLALRSLFDDEREGKDGPYCDEDDVDGGGVEGRLDEDDGDERSVMDIIRSCREGEGREFNVEDEIDRAAGMFIARVRRRNGWPETVSRI